jgi:hypothetical protein
MSYAQFGTIQAADYNALVGANPGGTANVLNTVWATGSGFAGYGQTAEANVAIGDTVTAVKWANLITKTANLASHQSSSITSVTAPASGNTITYNANVVTNLQTTYVNKLNAGTQGSTTANTIAYGSTWSTALTFTHTVTFANGDAARYFFNSGGQLKLTCSHANTTAGINLLFNNLASNVGTVVMSAPTTGAVTISSVSFNGITKVGGGGSAPTISTNSGYYAMTTSNANVFTQTASTGPSGYLSTFVRVIARSNGTVGSNGDVGNVVTLFTVWDEVPDGLIVGTGTTVTVTAQAPEITYLANSWGAITVAGSATGS